MSNEYRNNHYVPEWYQKRFIPLDQADKELYYLDVEPGYFTDPRGVTHPNRAVRRLGARCCFRAKDLYTTTFGSVESTELEKLFFGEIDRKGKGAVQYFAEFEHPSVEGERFHNLVEYMSTQRLRTPKGLGWLAQKAGTKNHQDLLQLMVQLRRLYAAIWAECVWLIADASKSDTKFIVSDHPVTAYNRRCGPRSDRCRGFRDPDIRLHGTHTIFPLSLEKILILTNLSWLRNPYQSETGVRPNPNLYRGAIFKFSDIQTHRCLSPQEVRQINFIIKSRALRYIAAAKEEWLYPEEHVSKSDWNTYGNGYLLMPDPRSVTFARNFIMGWDDGASAAYDEYGRRPWEPGFRMKEDGVGEEWNTFQRFQGEFARLHGPCRRGRSFNFMKLDNERDSDEYHAHHLSLEDRHSRKRS